MVHSHGPAAPALCLQDGTCRGPVMSSFPLQSLEENLTEKDELVIDWHKSSLISSIGFSLFFFYDSIDLPGRARHCLLGVGSLGLVIFFYAANFKILMVFRVSEVAFVIESLASMILDQVSPAFWLVECYSPSPTS
ncbi:hypothetical protein V6N13_108113 [Hibiscus sabdariffa]